MGRAPPHPITLQWLEAKHWLRDIPLAFSRSPPSAFAFKAGTTAEGPDTEETRISLELRDSFSFLDSQDAWQDDGAEGDPLPRSRLGETGPSLAGGMMDGFSAMDEDMESGFMNVRSQQH